MHDIITESRERACVHVHHLEISTQEWKWKQLSAIIQRIYMKGEEGVWGSLSPLRSPRNEKEVK